MKVCAPFHIKKYCMVDNDDNVYRDLVKEYGDSNHFVYKTKCLCGNTTFRVYRDEHPTVVIRCSECNKEIVVYDLKYYPAAIKLDDELQMEQFFYGDDGIFNVYPIYEYGELDDDIEFDENCISWCLIFLEEVRNNIVIKLIDDETA